MMSSELKITLSIVAIAAIIAGVAAAAVIFSPEEAKENYSISYEMNGGINSSANPDSYSIHETVDFKTPVREGYLFDGWYTESTFVNRIWSTEDQSADLQIYAKWHEKQVYTITYVLNGGSNSPKNPETYQEDSVVMLSHPTRPNSVFYGWFLTEDFSDTRIEYISRHVNSDITIYAKWGIDRSGYTLCYDNSGYYKTPVDWTVMYITGTTDYRYLNFTYEKGYHIKCMEDNSINTGTSASWSIDHDLSKWILEGYETVSYLGEDILCYIYTATIDGEDWTEYIGVYDNIPYIMKRYSRTTVENDGVVEIDMTYTYTGRYYTELSSYYNVTIYNDEGITSTGSGEYKSLSELTLKAEADDGYTFDGWYTADGVRADTSSELYIEMLSENIVLYAMNTEDNDGEFNSNVHLEPYESLRGVTWTYYADGELKTVEADIFEQTIGTAGEYTILYTGILDDGLNYYGLYRIVCKGDIERTYYWNYDGLTYSMILNINYDSYLADRYDDTERSRTYTFVNGKLVFDDEHTKQFVKVDSHIEYIASWFKEMKSLKGWSDYQTANCILKFVQTIPYAYDLHTKGVSEYWRYPLETLFDMCGDCEDTAFLYSAIAKAMGYKTALLLFDDHMASSLNIGYSGAYTFVYTDGSLVQYYYYCETTSTGWDVGVVPSGYTQYGPHYNYTIKGTIVGAVLPIL